MRRLLAVLGLVLGWAACAAAAAAYDNRTSSIAGSWTHAVGATANFAVAIFCIDGAPTVTSASVGSLSLSYVTTQISPGVVRCELWTGVNPPTGNQTVTVSWSGTDNDVNAVWTFSGVDTANPIGTPVGNAGSASPNTVSVVSGAGDLVVDGAGFTEPVTPTAGDGQVNTWNLEDGTTTEAVGSTKPGPGTLDLSWSFGAGYIAHLAVNVRGATTGWKTGPLMVR